jgi:hypothetical protein
MSPRKVFSLVLASFAMPLGLHAQELPVPGTISAIVAGSRVRLRAPTFVQGRLKGTVMQLDEKALTVNVDDRLPTKVPRDAITRLEVSTARKRQWRKGLVIGTAVGLFFASLIEVRPAGGCQLGDLFFCTSSPRGEVITELALGGAFYGAGIGALFKADRWREVVVDHVRVGVVPTRGRGLEISVSGAF